ncbi:tagaturonate reductase [Mongoliibacter ruber]|uniref:Tagaturonate reductase n=1 Tax=Mongoliibacter ruber TaxID=1750599 RepID=A0A2T0WGD2_9BACT|nr:tagaturonate reductase [Mongoliibacter ruber]PRY85759.1 tagaturonate reductase [Mongoliibacter ruber]
MKTLNRSNASSLKERPIKVLQFGEGNFLRGFADWMFDILNEKTAFDGDIQIVQPLKNGLGEMINQQDGLYHVLLQGILDGDTINESRLISCVRGVINPYDSWDNYLKLAENPDLKFIISNTTEAGIEFIAEDVVFESTPITFPAKLTALLWKRYNFFNGSKESGFVIIPCELIDQNGKNLLNCVLQYCKLWKLPAAFADWVVSSNVFCNTLVDRIVPGFPKDSIDVIQKTLGYTDNLVVKAEPFHLWVIEGPEELKTLLPVDKAQLNVKFVDDLTPYRLRKVRILNGAHTAMVPLAYLQGLRTVRECLEDKEFNSLLNDLIFKEITPTLNLPAEELNQFANDVLDRFRNPFVKHELSSIALNAISKFKVRVLPTIIEHHAKFGKLPKNLTASLAALILFYKGEFDGEKMPVQDDKDTVRFFDLTWSDETSLSKKINVILSNQSLWDTDLSGISGFAEAIEKEMELIMTTNAKD